jgi:outer membrane PBP1 activator LpoA protein
MLGKSLKGWSAALLLGAATMVGASAAPCETPGRLCASDAPNTSAQQEQPAPPQEKHPRAEEVVKLPAASATADLPAIPPVPAIRIALMLPLQSEALAVPAEAVRAGFMAAWERERDGIVVTVVATGDTPQQALEAYASAAEANDIVVGPLARSAVSALAASALVKKTTIALNYPEARAKVPPQMLVMGLSIEDDARQVAAWAADEHPGASALVLTAPSPWQKRLATAFMAQWKQLGRSAQLVELPASNGYLSEAALGQLKLRVEAEPPALLFAALDADQLRQVRAIVGGDFPFYSTASGNPCTAPGAAMAELDGLRLLDLPWVVQTDHPAVMVYPRRTGTGTLDLDRLYALGIDAFRVAREAANKPGQSFRLDGVTGRLSIAITPAGSSFERVQPSAVYQAGAYKPVKRR